MNVGHALRLQRGRRGSADAAAERYVHARGLSLERTEHQFITAQHVNAEPVDVVERVVKQRDEVGSIRERVRFIPEQRLGL